ncbi:MAG: hypothetical protein AAF334_08970 [Pseudomonadota bacterium]
MTYVVNLVAVAKPDEFENLVAYMTQILPDTASYAGAQIISCYTDPAANKLVVHEVWDSKESQQAYFGWRSETGAVDKIVSMLAEPPALEEYNHVSY